jgi:hypothetical protein
VVHQGVKQHEEEGPHGPHYTRRSEGASDGSPNNLRFHFHAYPSGQQRTGPHRWRVNLDEAEKQLLKTGLRAPEARELLASARRLLEEPLFWKNQCDGLAAFLGPQFLRLYRLPLACENLVVAGGRFQITPLVPLVASNGRYYVLALSQHAVRLLQGSRYSVSEVDLQGVPRSLAEAFLTHDSTKPFTFFGRRAGGPDSWGGIFHGHGVGLDDPKDELLQYFHRIDRGLHTLLRNEKAPLVVAAVDYLLPIYRQANTYPHLLTEGIEGNPDRLSTQELHERASSLVRPYFEQAQQKAAALYPQLAGTGRTAAELNEIVPAAYQGEVETLFVALGRQTWGRFDPATGQVEQHVQAQPEDEDLLNFAAVHTLLHGRTVYAVEPGQVPGGGPEWLALRVASSGSRWESVATRVRL